MSVLEHFIKAIEIQQIHDDKEYDDLMKLPLSERIAKGDTMSNLTIEFEFYDDPPNNWCPAIQFPEKFIESARVICENNISKFREGGSVVLSNGPFMFEMDIAEDRIDNFILRPNDFNVKNCYIDSLNYNKYNWEINIVKSSLTKKLLMATAGSLAHDKIRQDKIEELLSGRLQNPQLEKVSFSQLNESQNTAVKNAYGAGAFYIIQGPPGTGKTETISHMANLFLEEGKKVFVTAPTHTAINNCLNAIAEKVQDRTKVVKIGEKYQSTEIINNVNISRKPRLPYYRYLNADEFSQDGIIIGGTPYSLCYPASKRLEDWEFDVALIDEAAQLSIPLAISVMSRSDKFIFVGDHKQLDPIIPSKTGNPLLSESIFKRLVDLYPSELTLLNTSYRLNNDLIRIPNKLFYESQLKSAVSPITQERKFESEKHDAILNHPDSKVLFLHRVFDAQGRSPHEAKIVAELVADLFKNTVNLKDISILTPYRAQVREIKKAVAQALRGIGQAYNEEELFIDTVDRMQGQEKDYIIYSLSNSHPLESKRRLDFFYSPNRLNVAITRAMKKCIVIANYKVFDIIDEELLDLEEYDELKPRLDVFKEYYKLSTKVEESENEEVW